MTTEKKIVTKSLMRQFFKKAVVKNMVSQKKTLGKVILKSKKFYICWIGDYFYIKF